MDFDDNQEQKVFLMLNIQFLHQHWIIYREDEVQDYIDSNQTIEYAHTLEDQIQGQIEAGFAITGFMRMILVGQGY